MPWAVDFLPPHIIEFTNLVTSVDPYTGSGATSRFAMWPFLGINPQNPLARRASSVAQVRVLNAVPEPNSVVSDQLSELDLPYYFLPFAGAAPPLARLAPYFDLLCMRLATP